MAGGLNTLGNLLGKTNSANALVVTLDGGTASATVFLAGNGTAAAPAFSFTGDPDNGMYLSAADTLGWATAGVVRMTLSSTGALVTTDTITAGLNLIATNGLSVGASSVMSWATRSSLGSPANGQIKLSNQAITAGVVLDVATDAVCKLFARDGSSAATLQLPAGSTALAPLVITNGTNLSAAAANSIENDGTAFYSTIDTTNGRRVEDAWNFFELTGDGTGITTIADFFGATGSGIPLVANGRYLLEWHCVFTQATAGTATWTIVTATTALAVLDAGYVGTNIAGGGTVGAPQTAWVNTTTSSSTALPVTGTEATGVTHEFDVRAVVTAGNGASNTRLRLTMSAGTATPKAGSYIRVTRLPAANTGTFAT
jgi:hypothetical protein